MSGRGWRTLVMPRNRNTSAPARLFSWAAFVGMAFGRVWGERNRPLLFLVTNPPVSPILGYAAKKLRGQRYVLLFYDIYPEALVRFAGFTDQSLVVRAWRALNRAAIRHADGVITISPQLAHTLSQYTSGMPSGSTIHIVPMWVDTDWIRPIPKAENPFTRQHGQAGNSPSCTR